MCRATVGPVSYGSQLDGKRGCPTRHASSGSGSSSRRCRRSPGSRVLDGGPGGCRLSDARHFFVSGPLSPVVLKVGGPEPSRGENLRDKQERRPIAAPTSQEPRINDRIRAQQVRLVSPDGEQMGIQDLTDALDAAQEMGLDLVEVADKADPPVCRIMDYGKFKYEQSQRAKESRKKATYVLVKEMKYRPKIGPGDFATKTRKVEAFLAEGSKVKVTIMFRGREMQHPELGRRILDNVAEAVSHVGRVEVYPKQDGRNMVMVLVPGKATRKQREAAAERRAAAEESLAEDEANEDSGGAESPAAAASPAEAQETDSTSVEQIG
ncbi:MAG TPA: translation initiation factor IF-3 [Acidimicrobiaceae bacterium]|nr:translation initiation factor IF-3 [Acidimicrobiaceae bacterium]